MMPQMTAWTGWSPWCCEHLLQLLLVTCRPQTASALKQQTSRLGTYLSLLHRVHTCCYPVEGDVHELTNNTGA